MMINYIYNAAWKVATRIATRLVPSGIMQRFVNGAGIGSPYRNGQRTMSRINALPLYI